MNVSLENSITTTNSHSASDERKQSPPAFLDLADSVRSPVSFVFVFPQRTLQQAARLGSNMPDMSAVSFSHDSQLPAGIHSFAV